MWSIKHYERPKSIREAIQVLQAYGTQAKLIAGGTDLLIKKPTGITCLLDLQGLGLNYVKEEAGMVRIGACTTLNELARAPAVSQFMTLCEAIKKCSNMTIRNAATIGGNLGNASPAADLVPPLLVLGALLKISGPGGDREVRMEDFFLGPGQTQLGDSELITEIAISRPTDHSASSFLKLGRLNQDVAIVNTAVWLAWGPGGECLQARVALGAVAPTVVRAYHCEEQLLGRKLGEELCRKVSQVVKLDICPIDDVRASAQYRLQVAPVLVTRCLQSTLLKAGLISGRKD